MCTYILELPSQCFSYTINNNESRNINAPGGNNSCDLIFLSGSVWIHFTGDSGTELARSPTRSNRCGAQVTGWYADRMPAITETIADGKVCFSWLSGDCQWSNTIGVTNCGSFYVYQLKVPPVCAARYCTDTDSNIILQTSTGNALHKNYFLI